MAFKMRKQLYYNGETELKLMEQFTSVGISVVSQNAWCEHDIKRRINLATGVAVALGMIWK